MRVARGPIPCLAPLVRAALVPSAPLRAPTVSFVLRSACSQRSRETVCDDRGRRLLLRRVGVLFSFFQVRASPVGVCSCGSGSGAPAVCGCLGRAQALGAGVRVSCAHPSRARRRLVNAGENCAGTTGGSRQEGGQRQQRAPAKGAGARLTAVCSRVARSAPTSAC